jgi:hypothetical protein
MKSLTVIASSFLLCSCADMVVTKTYVAGGSSAESRSDVDAKDFGSRRVHFTTNCGIGEAHPAAIYIRPFCVDQAIFRGDETVSEGEMPIRKSMVPVAFAENLKEELEKLAPARILEANEMPHVGWLVEGEFQLIDGGDPDVRFWLTPTEAGRSHLLLHVRVTNVEKGRVIYEFDMAGGSHDQGRWGTVLASGLGKATPFDLRNAAERIMLVLSPDPFRFGARSSVSLRHGEYND